MKDLLKSLLEENASNELAIKEVNYSIVGSCFDMKLERPNGQTFHTVVELCEIVAVLLEMGLITGYDSFSRMAFVPQDNAALPASKHLHQVLKSHDHSMHRKLIDYHLQQALHILESGQDPEHLWPYFKDYTLLQKQALLWMLSQKADIADFAPRHFFNTVQNYLDGTDPYLSGVTVMEIRLFARWLKSVGGGLYAIAPKPNAHPSNWVQTPA